MPFIKQEQDTSKFAAAIGSWSALLAAVLNIWFYVAYSLYHPIQFAPWHGLTDYAASFQLLPLLAWVIPCFLLAPTYLIMSRCLQICTGTVRHIWSSLAVDFAVVYTTLMSLNYYIQMTVVQHNLSGGSTDGLSLWLYAYPYPHSLPGAFEGVAYGFMCCSFLFAAQVFAGDKLRRWVHWMLVGTGTTGLVVFIDPLFRLPFALLVVDGFACGIFLTLALVLLAIVFRRGIHPSRGMNSQEPQGLERSKVGYV